MFIVFIVSSIKTKTQWTLSIWIFFPLLSQVRHVSAPWWPAGVQGPSSLDSTSIRCFPYKPSLHFIQTDFLTERLQLLMFVENMNVCHHPVVVTDQPWSRSSAGCSVCCLQLISWLTFLSRVVFAVFSVSETWVPCCEGHGGVGQGVTASPTRAMTTATRVPSLQNLRFINMDFAWVVCYCRPTFMPPLSLCFIFVASPPPNKAPSVQWKACGHGTNGLWRK